jgi:hypothetical protein
MWRNGSWLLWRTVGNCTRAPPGETLSDNPQQPPSTQPPSTQPPSTQPPSTQPPSKSGPDGTGAPTPPGYAPAAAPVNQPPTDHPPTTPFPSVNYAPPGYTPDYGQGYQYPPPPYGPGDYPPAGPPPRKSNVPLIAVVVAVALLLCGGVATAGILVVHTVKAKAHEAVKPLTDPTLPDDPDLPGGGFPTDLPTEGGKQIQVTYEVTGDGPAEIIYLSKLGESPTRAGDVKLPWRFTAPMETPTLISIIAMRTGNDDGSISCRALVDGKEVKKATSSDNGFATAACTYFALD